MPSKNTVKIYAEDSFYHVYNRGVDRQVIFQDAKDYAKFLQCLKDALSPPRSPETMSTQITVQGSTFNGMARMPKNFYQSIELHVYCLMPNHFHLLLKQHESYAIKTFMQSILTRYSMYFNLKYKRTGHVFTGIYKASLIQEDSYLLQVSRYIHRNPISLGTPIRKAYSSYPIYLLHQDTPWLKTGTILDYFASSNRPISISSNTYEHFVEYEKFEDDDIDIL